MNSYRSHFTCDSITFHRHIETIGKSYQSFSFHIIVRNIFSRLHQNEPKKSNNFHMSMNNY